MAGLEERAGRPGSPAAQCSLSVMSAFTDHR
jgi:hypothetical protein